VNELAIVALTPHGLNLGRRLAQCLGRGEVLLLQGSARPRLEELFRAGRPLVCIMALGIVVRLLGPLARDKETDPPVVVVDEAGRFAISVLGGHVGGANDLAREVAATLQAQPVITTASEALGLPAVDLIGRDWGWKIEGRAQLTSLAAAVVRGETIGVYQDAGRHDWWVPFGSWPATFHRLSTWPPDVPCAGYMVISDRRPLPLAPFAPAVAYRPPTLFLGVGCRRGVPCDEIQRLFQEVCDRLGYDPLSLAVIATADIKAAEPGLQEFAALHQVALKSFSLDELGRVPNLPTPSERVRARIGISGVAEPAALLAAGTDRLVMPKHRGPRVTMAVARRDDA
jgi:cobalt-precorrin 5A hydrolase